MHTVDARTPRTHGLEQADEAGHSLQAAERPVALERLVDQLPVHPVEEPHVEQELAVVGGQVGPQPRLDPAGDDVPGEPLLAGRGVTPPVAVHAHGDRPAGGRLGHRGEAPPRQRQVEEPGDLGQREAQVLREQDLRRRVEHRGGDVEPGRQLPAGQRQVQVARAGRHEGSDEGGRHRVGEALDFVQGQHAGGAVRLDRAQEQGRALERAVAPSGSAPVTSSPARCRAKAR